MPPNTANLRSLDALRGLLATYVLLGHARFLLWAGHAEWTRHAHAAWENAIAYASAGLQFGHEAVMVFFALSGFFIHFRAAQAQAGGRAARCDPADFFRRRAHRILPPYALALLVTLACDFAGSVVFPALYRAETGDALLDLNFARKGYDPQAVFPALFALPSTLGRDFGSNAPLWSLSFEVCYYLAYPAWLRLRLAGPRLAFIGVPLACLLLGWAYPQVTLMRIVFMYPVWISGAWLAEVTLKSGFRFGGLVPSLALILGGVAVYHSEAVPWARPIVASLFGAATVGIFCGFSPAVCARSWHRLCEILGVQSYTIYITHFPVLTLGCALLFASFGARPMSGYAAVTGSLVSLLLGSGFFLVCEKRFLHRRLRVDEGKQ